MAVTSFHLFIRKLIRDWSARGMRGVNQWKKGCLETVTTLRRYVILDMQRCDVILRVSHSRYFISCFIVVHLSH